VTAQELDLSIQVAGVRFRSPLVVSSSECTADLDLVLRLCKGPVGALVTKTFTSNPAHKVRVRPYQFPLRALGKGFREGKALYSLAAPHVEGLDAWCRTVSHMAELSRRRGVVLVASFFEEPDAVDLWVETAGRLEAAGPAMLELNFSCPHVSETLTRRFETAVRILEGVLKASGIPAGVKIGPSLEPLESAAAALENAGAAFLTAHNAPGGIVVDVEREEPFGAPAIGGYAPGRTFLPMSLARVVRIRKAASIPVIGVGGVSNHRDALQYLLVGCPLVGVGSALYFDGPPLMERMHRGLADWMKKKGYESLEDVIGRVFPRIENAAALGAREPYPYTLPPDGPYVPKADASTCTACGACVRGCIYGALEISEAGCAEVDADRCWSCGFCVGVCPEGAVSLRDRRDPDRVVWNNRGTARSFVE
jgi:dihydroorotate dehydrogenase/NAD-dependent dihydropyrimidine dehydrogenase PreA subunit